MSMRKRVIGNTWDSSKMFEEHENAKRVKKYFKSVKKIKCNHCRSKMMASGQFYICMKCGHRENKIEE